MTPDTKPFTSEVSCPSISIPKLSPIFDIKDICIEGIESIDILAVEVTKLICISETNLPPSL